MAGKKGMKWQDSTEKGKKEPTYLKESIAKEIGELQKILYVTDHTFTRSKTIAYTVEKYFVYEQLIKLLETIVLENGLNRREVIDWAIKVITSKREKK